MSEQPHQPQTVRGSTAEVVLDREAGLHRSLTSRQVAMIGLGCTIGTGLFLGSAISVKLAGPAVIVSFLVGADYRDSDVGAGGDGGGTSDGGIFRAVRGNVRAPLGGICDSLYLLAVPGVRGGQRSGGGLDLL